MSVSSNKPARAEPGDLLKIPYGDGHAIWGRVVYNDARGVKKKRGLYLAVLDRDVAPGDDLNDVVRAPVLLGPLHCGTELVADRTWEIAGNVAPTEAEQQLPYFEDRLGVVDYFFERVSDTAANRARMVPEYIAMPDLLPDVVRAARGLAPWQPGYERFRAKRA